MGIPNFFPWLIKRYPLCMYDFNENTKNQTDFLFLDLNQIVYKCSSDSNILFKDQVVGKETQEIFIDVFNYINYLIDIIEPQQVLYIVFDGVSPVAKQNQQRQRRALSTKNQQKIEEQILEIGVKKENIHNFIGQISPGTDFMEQLDDQIKYFIKRKFHEDSKWKNLQLIFSGSDVPGEGEHKILEFIRELKRRPNFNQQWTFTIYGSDADLILLALTTRLMNIIIIREKQVPYQSEKYSVAGKRVTQKLELQILNIGIVRDYFDLEYREIENKMKLQYKIDRIIDDFILLLTFIGNDFLPRIYSFDIKAQSFEILVSMFKQNLLVANQYIIDDGKINWFELCRLSEKLSQFQRLFHQNRINEIKLQLQSKDNVELRKELDTLQSTMDFQAQTQQQQFYLNIYKLDINENPEIINQMSLQYLYGVQFIMYYYFNGLPSWNWSYQFYYAPLINNIFQFLEINYQTLSINFEKGEPQVALKSLLSILSPSIAYLLPAQYSILITDPNSPLRQPIDYYPISFEVDNFGSKCENIVKYPFLEPQAIDQAFNSVQQQPLRNKYLRRLQHGKIHIYHYNQNKSIQVQSNSIFPEFNVKIEEKQLDSQDLVSEIETYITPVNYSISKMPYLPRNDIIQTYLETRLTYDSTRQVLNLKFKNTNKTDLLDIIQTKGCWVYCGLIKQEYGYALGYMKSTNFTVCSHKAGQEIIKLFKLTGNSVNDFKNVNENIKKDLIYQGIESDSQIIVFVAIFKKITRLSDGKLQTVNPVYKAYNIDQVFIQKMWDSKFLKEQEQLNEPIKNNDLFQQGSIHMMFVPSYFENAKTQNGSIIRVLNYDVKEQKILGETIDFVKKHVVQKIQHHFNVFYTIQFTVKKLNITVETLLRILGSVKIQLPSTIFQVDGIDIGLNLIDIFGNQIIPEYIRIRDIDSSKFYQPSKFIQNLELSQQCINVLCEYKLKFPEIFQFLKIQREINEGNHIGLFKVTDIYANEVYGVKKIMQIFVWILQLPFNNLNFTSPCCQVLSSNEIKDQAQFTTNNQLIQSNQVIVNPGFVQEKPTKSYYVPPFFTTQPEIHTLNSRVINLNSVSSRQPQFGSTGTVIGIIHSDQIYVEILWDEPQIGLTSLGGRCPSMRGSICRFDDVFNLSLGWADLLCCSQSKLQGWDRKKIVFTPVQRSKAISNELELEALTNQIKSVKNPFLQYF